GKSEAMQEVYELMLQAAAHDANIILYGESGTGKELAARAIHDMSDRRNGNFVPVNRGAIPENLVEREFFGHKKARSPAPSRTRTAIWIRRTRALFSWMKSGRSAWIFMSNFCGPSTRAGTPRWGETR
ncbi:MAG: sigma-54 factor interaction domain-containing protein, partial [Desulfobacterales bacterium]|nr:sigma-54 factor interaction domain-containing protein [Desulfobacterales bacterium]